MTFKKYKNIHDFPFPHYFNGIQQYIAAQNYWLHVLRSSASFSEQDWQPNITQNALDDDMYTGRVIWISSNAEAKEIMLHTSSIAGYAHMIQKENSGMNKSEIAEAKELFGPDFEMPDELLKPISPQEAMDMATEKFNAAPADIWVETQAPLTPQNHATERLIINAEISERAEPLVVNALELFLMPGPATDRVNGVFAPRP